MKSIIRWMATIGLVGGTMLTSLSLPYKAFALPEEQIVKTLQSVPVFAIADDQGVPLVATGEKNQKITGVFISQQDAQAFFDRLKKENPQVASKVKVQPVSLAQVYKLQTSQKDNSLIVDFVPKASEVESAKKLLTDRGQKYEGGVPLFVPKAGKEGNFLVINRNNQDFIPFFFEKAAALNMAEQYKKANPNEASTVKIDVIPLESVIATLQQSNDEALTKILLYPTQETLNFIRANANQQNTGNRPASNPAPANNNRPAPNPAPANNNRPAPNR